MISASGHCTSIHMYIRTKEAIRRGRRSDNRKNAERRNCLRPALDLVGFVCRGIVALQSRQSCPCCFLSSTLCEQCSAN